jgi:hypothetical protein
MITVRPASKTFKNHIVWEYPSYIFLVSLIIVLLSITDLTLNSDACIYIHIYIYIYIERERERERAVLVVSDRML